MSAMRGATNSNRIDLNSLAGNGCEVAVHRALVVLSGDERLTSRRARRPLSKRL
jgi:hypothetical protein